MKDNCLVVTCIPCHRNEHLECPDDKCDKCDNCGMLDWLCFETEEIANYEYKKQNPKQFDENGNYKGEK
jgi:hypothetical protein